MTTMDALMRVALVTTTSPTERAACEQRSTLMRCSTLAAASLGARRSNTKSTAGSLMAAHFSLMSAARASVVSRVRVLGRAELQRRTRVQKLVDELLGLVNDVQDLHEVACSERPESACRPAVWSQRPTGVGARLCSVCRGGRCSRGRRRRALQVRPTHAQRPRSARAQSARARGIPN